MWCLAPRLWLLHFVFYFIKLQLFIWEKAGAGIGNKCPPFVHSSTEAGWLSKTRDTRPGKRETEKKAELLVFPKWRWVSLTWRVAAEDRRMRSGSPSLHRGSSSKRGKHRPKATFYPQKFIDFKKARCGEDIVSVLLQRVSLHCGEGDPQPKHPIQSCDVAAAEEG